MHHSLHKMNDFQEHIQAEMIRCEEDCIKQVYKEATGNDLTTDNAKDITLACKEGVLNMNLIAIRGNVVGAIVKTMEGNKYTVSFNPDIKDFTAV